MVDVAPLAAWINEREAIRLRKQVLETWPVHGAPALTFGQAAAWGDKEWHEWGAAHLTDDPVLSQFRFCNVYRELDRVTVWIRQHIREPFADHEALWFMLCVARTINWPETISDLMYMDAWPEFNSWHPRHMTRALETRKARGDKVYTGAYMIRAESDPRAEWYAWSKQRYIAEIVLGRLWEHRLDWQAFLHTDNPNKQYLGLEDVWKSLQDYTGWGPFMAYQVAVDMRWTRYLRDAPDVHTFAALGPGSRRGLNRLLGRPVGAAMGQEEGLSHMRLCRAALEASGLLAPWVELPELSDVQNCLCEYDKYERVRLGEGRPRTRYVPGRGW